MNQQNGIFVRFLHDIKKDLKLKDAVCLSQLRVCNGEMLVVIKNQKILHHSVTRADKHTELTVPLQPSDSIEHIHLSPSGQHAIASSKNGDNYYINVRNKTVLPLKSIKGVITAVGWNQEVLKDSETGQILLGTSKGAILEVSILTNGTCHYVKEHIGSFGGENLPISNIYMFLINDDDQKATKWALLICLPGRLYSLTATLDLSPKLRSTFMSSASLQAGWASLPEAPTPQHIFHPFFTPKENQQCLLTMPNSGRSEVQSSNSALVLDSQGLEATRFAWLGPAGTTVGKVSIQADGCKDILIEEKHIEHRRIEGKVEAAIGVSLTEYHVLIAYPSLLSALSLNTYAVMYEDVWPSDLGSAVGVTCDPTSEFHWLCTASTIIKYRPQDEARYVWRVFLDEGDFAKALSVAIKRRAIDPEAHELVLKKQADKYIAEKKYTAAAEVLSQSREPFETVVLKFLSTEDDRRLGLKTLLEKRLDKITGHDEKMKRDALVLWLLEVQLAELAEAKRDVDKEGRVSELTRQLHGFLARKNVHESVDTNKDAVYRLMVSHADFDSQLYLATLLKDISTVISIHLFREQYKEVLGIIKLQNTPDLLYTHATTLVEHIPLELFGMLIENESFRPQRLLPVLCLCLQKAKARPDANSKEKDRPDMIAGAMRYLEWAVTKTSAKKDVSLHNLLIAMYAKIRQMKLYEYLVEHGSDRAMVPYDIDFALRTCEQHGLHRCTILLYCVLELFGDAVDLALQKYGVDVAKECAHMMDASEDDIMMGLESQYPKEMRKKIWLKIAQHVIGKDGDAVECIRLLKESNDVLTLQDILPFFPEFTKIEHFKEPLCESLKEHSTKIASLQQAMKDAVNITHEIREQADRLKNRVIVIKAGDVCSGCDRSLAGQPFYAHACRHFFHRQCLEQQIMAFLTKEKKAQLSDLIAREDRLLFQLNLEDASANKATKDERENRYDQVSREINSILGEECPLCGTQAIELIDKPFCTDEEYENDAKSW